VPLLGALLVFADTFGYAVVVPLLPFFAVQHGASTAAVGAIFATYSLCQLVAAPLLGGLSERTGRRPVLLLSQAGSALGFLLLALSGSLWPVFVSRVVDGVTAGNIGTVTAMVVDTSPRETWASRFAMLGAATGGGIVAGLATSALLAPLGMAAGALAAMALALLLMLLTALLVPETLQREAGEEQVQQRGGGGRTVAQARRITGTLTAALLGVCVQAAFLVTLPLYLLRTLGYHAQTSGVFLTALVGGAGLFQLGVVPRAPQRMSERNACLLGFAFVVAGGAVCAGAGSLPVVALGAALAVAGVVTLQPAFTALIAAAGVLDTGTLMGLNQSIASAGQMLGPVLGYGALAVAGGGGYGVLCVLLSLGGAAITARSRGVQV